MTGAAEDDDVEDDDDEAEDIDDSSEDLMSAATVVACTVAAKEDEFNMESGANVEDDDLWFALVSKCDLDARLVTDWFVLCVG